MPIPEIKRGDLITEKYLNQLGAAGNRVLRGVGTFGNDDLSLIAPVPGGSSGSGRDGDPGIKVAICTAAAGIASSFDPGDWGTGSCVPISWDGSPGIETTFYNISADPYVEGQPFPYVIIASGRLVALPPWCNLMVVPDTSS